MNWKVTLRITNRDDEIDHPQARKASWSHTETILNTNESEAKSIALIRAKRIYPDCTASVSACEEATPISGGFRQAEVSDKKDSTLKRREK